MAELKPDTDIHLWELKKYLDSGMAADKFLLIDQHRQTPVADGNPNFLMALVDTLSHSVNVTSNTDALPDGITEGLADFQSQDVQPIDYFFVTMRQRPLENILKFADYDTVAAARLPARIINDCIAYQKQLNDSGVETTLSNIKNIYENFSDIDSLQMLGRQLKSSKPLVADFNDRLIQLVQDKGQDMINAYLAGDATELERRQYYYSGYRSYKDYLDMLHIVRKIVPQDHHLAGVLAVDDSYLSGLVNRLNMATYKNTDSLLQLAMQQQQAALQLEPYAAYIHNELGNLYLHQKKFDSSDYHFKLATVLAPTWAIPWANEIRLNLARNNMPQALQAVQRADSLQPDLSFVLMNAGLAMEKVNNLLAAEAYYRRAIELNKVHFLPYERLARICLMSGRYPLADSFYYEADIRKQYFTINDSYFEYGVELGGVPVMPYEEPKFSCTQGSDKNLLVYERLLNAFDQINNRPGNYEAEIKALQDVLKHSPAMPLVNHYLGKALFTQGDLPAAAAALQQALRTHLSPRDTWVGIKQTMPKNVSDSNQYCMLGRLSNYGYDVLEDRYMLANIYQQQQQWNKAIEQYTIISDSDNHRQAQQAVFKDYPDMNILLGEPMFMLLFQKYDEPMLMGGAYKLEQLYEQKEDYLMAEQTLLKQVYLNRKAGFIREKAYAGNIPGTWLATGGLKINFYWLAVNRYAEAAMYNFYQRMMALYPRDYLWKEKAGLFLHQRLAMTFSKVPVEQYVTFTASIPEFKYPFTGDEMSANIDSAVLAFPDGDTMIISMPVYNPVTSALDLLQQSVALSPDVETKPQVKKAIADLDSWSGNNDEAISLYKQLVQAQPLNDTLRNKLITFLTIKNYLPQASEQLTALYKNKQADTLQITTLAGYNYLAGKTKDAIQLLQPLYAGNSYNIFNAAFLKATVLCSENKTKQALQVLTDSLPPLQIAGNDYDMQAKEKMLVANKYYATARTYALLKNNSKALSLLKQAIDTGFAYKYVLNEDAAWNNLRNKKTWKSLINRYGFKDYNTTVLNGAYFINPIEYRIPELKYFPEYLK